MRYDKSEIEDDNTLYYFEYNNKFNIVFSYDPDLKEATIYGHIILYTQFRLVKDILETIEYKITIIENIRFRTLLKKEMTKVIV